MEISSFLEPGAAENLEQKRVRLFEILKNLNRVLVCFSGGVDSSYVCYAALKALGRDNVLAATAVSPSLSEESRQEISAWILFTGVRHEWIETAEFNNPAYLANNADRCYFCKTELYAAVMPLARGRNLTVIDGSNFSDLQEHRPGYLAARQNNVLHPLEEAGLSKPEIVELARHSGLPNWNRPASPCLSSRIPHGQAVTREALEKVDQAERIIKSFGLRVVRVRHLAFDTAKIETSSEEMPALEKKRQEIIRRFSELGFTRVAFGLYPATAEAALDAPQ
ncbi:MAG: ATP-dependent sacrificial sulfur transferase LarE [Elusimicrobia bacterium]|nr:ATP-dependent sacrificial sulfur transferase LarE [Elusimicrobiota bacterium]